MVILMVKWLCSSCSCGLLRTHLVISAMSIGRSDIPKLDYTEKVFTESIRLYPPAWAVGGQAIHDRKIGEYTIPGGSTVLMSRYLIHRDP
jgi:cytochrome P450